MLIDWKECLRLVILFGTLSCVLAERDQISRTKRGTQRATRGEIVIDGLDWKISSKNVPRGSPPAVTVNVTLTLEDNNGYVSGKRLWRLGLFGSKYNDGWGPKKNEVQQLLSPKQQNQRARGGYPLKFIGVEGEFDYTEFGCNNYRFVCFELAKGDNPNPDFQLRLYTFQPTLIECTEVELECQQPEVVSSPSCSRTCPYDPSPVCGSNGHTYQSRCEIENEIACYPNEPLEILFEDNCNNSVTIRSIFWGVDATDYNRNGLSEISIDTIVLTQGPINVFGNDLWRMGIFGSRYLDGHGPRMGYQRQILNATEAASPLIARLPISLMFLVAVQFDVSSVGCNRYKFLCLEFAKGDDASPDFPFRSSNGKGVFIGCRPAPCNGPEDDGTGRPQVLFDSFRWAVRAFGTVGSSDLANIRLNVSALIQDRSDEIRGTNLWRIGLFGSANQDGSGERFGYVRQTITDNQVSTPAIPGGEMEFNIDTQFRIDGVGCDDYGYLCADIGKGDNADPDFIMNRENNGRPFIVCQQVPCHAPEPEFTPSIARLSALDWNMEVTDLNFNGPSNITVQFTVTPDVSTDVIEGKGLWRLGMYFSTREDGEGVRHRYQPQILPKEYANSPLTPRFPMYFLDVISQVDVIGMGCDEWQFVCIEFAKGSNPRPDFGLPLPGALDYVASCRQFPCIGHPVREDKRATMNTLSWSFRAVEKPRSRQKTQVLLNVSVPVPPDSDDIRGRYLWRVGMYGSTRKNGKGDKFGYVRQTILDNQVSSPAVPGRNMDFLINTRFDVTGVGCGTYTYMCVELAKGDYPDPEFIFNEPRKGKPIVACQQVPCRADNEPTPRAALFSSMDWNFQVRELNLGGLTNVTVNVIARFADDLDVIQGDGLWRLGLFFSSTMSGRGDRREYSEQILPTKYSDMTLDPRESMIFRKVAAPIDISGLGCGRWRYICVEFAKGNDPSTDFELEFISGGDTEVSCRSFPCVGGAPVNKGPLQATFDSLIWRVTADKGQPGELSNLALHVSIPVPPTSSEIRGQNLWRLGLYGSRLSNGTGDKFGYVRQAISADVVSPHLVPGYIMEITTTTQFMLYGLGCGGYDYLCVEMAKGDNPDPDFIFNPEDGGKPIVLCQWVECQNPDRAEYDENRRMLVARLASLYWNAEVTDFNVAGPSNLTFQATIIPTGETDEIEGQRLWRFGMFFSNTADGQTGRLRYISQILPPKYSDHSLSPWQPLVFDNVTTLVDVTGLGCDTWRFLCVEFAKGVNATPDFELPMPGGIKVAVSCRAFPCMHVAGASGSPNNQGEAGGPNTPNVASHDTPPGTQEDTTEEAPSPTLPSVVVSNTRISNLQHSSDRVSFVLTVTSSRNSAALNGENLWRVEVYSSSDRNGVEVGYSPNHQILNSVSRGTPLTPGSELVFEVDTPFLTSGIGCGDMRYLCIEFGKADHPVPDYNLVLPDSRDSILTCQLIPCEAETVPELIVNSVSVLLPPTATPIISGQQNQIPMDFDIIYDASKSDQIDGENIWRVKVWGSSRANGGGRRISQNGQVLTEAQASKTMILGRPFTIRGIEYDMNLRGVNCLDVNYICAQLIAGKTSLEDTFTIRPVPNKKSLMSCQRITCVNGVEDP